jgi:hypothetical protein
VSLTVDTPAEHTALTTREAVKSDLSITGSTEDAYIDRMIPQVSERVCRYLNVAVADDGTCTIGRETLTETITVSKCGVQSLFLARWLRGGWPVTINSVTEGTSELATTDYEYNPRTGALTRMNGGDATSWATGAVVIEMDAGWYLPEHSGRNLPYSIEAAAIAWIKGVRASRTRDGMLAGESFLEGLYSYRLFSSSGENGPGPAPPAEVEAILSEYADRFGFA